MKHLNTLKINKKRGKIRKNRSENSEDTTKQ